MSNNWNFPNNGGGQIRGISDAGIETFTGTEIQSLAREICQNSLDANDTKVAESVHVEFERYKINTNKVPGYADYKDKINKARYYWTGKRSEKAITYLNNAVKAIGKPNTYVLRISDYNTIGLLDPYGESDDGWNALIKIDGGATKTGDKAGAFGIGKNAPFCNSDYRLVFYRTLNTDGEIAAQGVSRLISFPEDLNDTRNTMTTGIGYYGNTDGNLPTNTISELNELNTREKVGTDVFVYGFNAGLDWKTDVICEVLNNFLMAIHRNQLSVSVENDFISNKTLSEYMHMNEMRLKEAICYYKVLTNPTTETFMKDFHGLGTLKLSVLVDTKDKLNRKILVTRTSGMKLFAIGNISSLITFSGVLEMQGKELNEYFREMETPAHDKWLPSRYTKNPTQAKEYHNELKQWIREIVLSLGEYSSDEETEVEGLSGVLQKESSMATQQGESKREGLQDTINNVVIQPRVSATDKAKGLFYGIYDRRQSQKRDTDGTIGEDGFPATRTLGGYRTRTTRETHRGTPVTGGRDKVHERYGGDKNQPLKNVRIIKVGMSNYRASFFVPKDIKSGHIEIVTVGENGKYNKLHIKTAGEKMNCRNVSCNGTAISFSEMKGNEKILIEFSLVDSRDYAMEVNVYEHN